jgi:hypothetical protein
MTTQPISLNCVLDHLTPQDDPEAWKAILGVIGEEFEVATTSSTLDPGEICVVGRMFRQCLAGTT